MTLVAVCAEFYIPYLETVAERFWDLPDEGGMSDRQEIEDLLRPVDDILTSLSYLEANMACG